MREGVHVYYLVQQTEARQYNTGSTIKAQNENSIPIVNLENKVVTLVRKPIRDFTSLILLNFNLSKEKS